MVTLLQAYERECDAAAVEEAVFDRRWQLVFDCMGAEDPVFSQRALVDFRRRLIEHRTRSLRLMARSRSCISIVAILPVVGPTTGLKQDNEF